VFLEALCNLMLIEQLPFIISQENAGSSNDLWRSLAFSREGKLLAAGGSSKVISVWDAGSGKLFHELRGHAEQIYKIKFSKNERSLISSGLGRKGAEIIKWDATNGNTVWKIELEHGITDFFFSADNGILICAATNSMIETRSAATGAFMNQLGGETPIALSGNRELLAATYSKDSVRLFDMSSGRKLQDLSAEHQESSREVLLCGHECIHALAFSPDSSKLVAAGGKHGASGYGVFRVWNIQTGKLEECRWGQGAIELIEFHPASESLITVDQFGDVVSWSVKDWKPQQTIRGYSGSVLAMAISPDGTRLAIAGMGTNVSIYKVSWS
jgi:WD40 repeat protein